MKIVLVLLAALCGLATGIHYPLSYEYEYSGEVKTGVHELRNQFAGAALKATLKVTVVSSSEAHVQISNPRVGAMNGDVPFSGRAALPISGGLVPLKDKAAVEQSFSLHFSGQQEKLEVPSSEMLWISNLRKAVVSLLRVPFVLSSPVKFSANVRENRIMSEGELPRSFKREEETIHGKCSVLYTLTKAAPGHSMHLQELKEDAQHSVGGQNQSAYRLVRSVDFHDCSDRVVLKKSSHGNLTEAGVGQLRGIQSRSSVGEYLLSGEPTSELSMRIEQAIVEGIVTLNPFGHETRKIMTISNQTLSLIKTTHARIVPKPTSHMKVEGWALRVQSPYQRGVRSPSWISFQGNTDPTYPMYPEKDFTGFRLTSELRQQLQQQIKSEVQAIARQVQQPNSFHQSQFGGSSDGAAVQKLESVVSRLRALPTQAIEQLYQQIAGSSSASSSPEQQIKRELFISALKASGSAAAYKVLIAKMRTEQFSPFDSVNVFVSMSANVASPAIVHDLIDYVTSLPDNAPIALKSSALINLSTLIRRLCINKSVKTYSTPVEMMGRHQCNRQQIASKYIPYLQHKVHSVSKDYLRAIFIQALANLGDISSVKLLGQIAEGILFREQTAMRLLAIQGLTKNHMQNTSYPEAQEILLAIAEEQVEKPELREAAIASLFTLPKNATFWHRMALSTWREPSRRVASFVYSSIKSFAGSRNPHFVHQISMAKHVLPQAKPQPRSPYYSAMMLASDYEVTKDIGAIVESYYLSSSTSKVPQMLAAKLKAALGGMKYPIIHVSTIGKGLEQFYQLLMDKLKGIPTSSKTIHSQNSWKSSEEFEKATEGHRMTGSQSDEGYGVLFAHLTILKHMEMFAPITTDSLDQLNDPNKSLVAYIFQCLSSGKNMQSISYLNPVESTEILPSDIGLPIITQISRPTMIYAGVKARATTVPGPFGPFNMFGAKYFDIAGEAAVKLVMKSESSMKVLVPWNNKTLVTGMDGESTFSMLANFSSTMDRQSSSQQMFQIVVQPNFQSKSPVLFTRNLPFTLVRDLLPSRAVTEESVKPINVVRSSPSFATRIPISKVYTGVEAEIDYKGDAEFPINQTTIWEHLMNPIKMVALMTSPTTRQYQLSLQYSPQQSQTKNITATFWLASIQSGPKGGSDRAKVVEDLSTRDSMEQRIQKLSQSGVASIISASLNFSGSEPSRQYEFAFLNFQQQQPLGSGVQRMKAEFQVNLMRSPLPSPSQQRDQQACISTAVQYPSLPHNAHLSDVLKSNLDLNFVAQVYTGEKCSQSNEDILIQGNQTVSEERKAHLQTPQLSDDQYQPLDSTEAVKSSLVYDRISVDIKEQKSLSDSVRNFTNHVSDDLHGLLFPLITRNSINIHGEQGRTVIQGYRSLAADHYSIWIRSSEAICLVQDLKVSPIFDYASPLNGYLAPDSQSSYSSVKMVTATTSEKCVLTPDAVSTFAGVQYNKTSSTCPIIAVKNEKERFVILTNQTEESASAEQQLNIIYPRSALNIVIKKSEILINGAVVSGSQKEVKSSSGQIVAKVFQSSSSRKVEIPGRFSVELEDGHKAIIQMDQRYISQLAGTCGHYGTDQVGDLRDSHGCLYTPAIGARYSASWIASFYLQQCIQASSQSYKNLISEVEKYQENCPVSLQAQASQRWPRH